MPKNKSVGEKFEVVVNHPGAVKGHTTGDVISDPSDALIALAKESSLLTLRKVRGDDTRGGPPGGQGTEQED